MVDLIWATRGRSWGFRFLLTGDYTDPLTTYERAFFGIEGEPAICRRIGDHVALRFPDPLNRADTAGRIIPHDFVVPDPTASGISSLDDGLRVIWNLVADIYATVWDAANPPTTVTIQSAIDQQ